VANNPGDAQIVRANSRYVLPIILTAGEDGYVIAACPMLPGCISQGRTREEALANIAEAAELTLSCREEEGWDVPAEYRLERIEVSA